MKKNRLLLAIVVLLGVGALAVNASRSHRASTSTEAASDAKLPSLKKEDLTEVSITRPSKETIVLSKLGDTWTVTKPLEAPADTTNVDAVLDKLTAFEVTGTAATRKANHKRLQVDAETAIHVTAKVKDKAALDLYVGLSKAGNTMVREADKEAVLSVRGSIRFVFDKELKLFRDRVITDAKAEDITAVSLKSDKGGFLFEKDGEAWKQAKNEKPIKKFAGSKVGNLVSTFARLRAADFAAADTTDEAAGLATPTATLVLTNKDGSTLTLTLGKQHASGSEYYLRASGKQPLYRLSKYTAERMLADAEAFIEDDKPKTPPAAPMQLPPGMGGPGGGPGGGQIPPEVLRQLQQQMQQRGGQ